MIKKAIICLFLSIPILGYSQKFRVGIANVSERKFSISEFTTLGGLSIFEGNKFKTPTESPYLGFEYSVSDKFKASVGIQYYLNSISLMVVIPMPNNNSLPYSLKIQSVFNDNFEFPLEVSYIIFSTGKINWMLKGGIVPVFTSSSSKKYQEVPDGSDWSQEVVDALHATETIPKSFYMNYQYGLGMEFKKFELSLFKSTNLNRSISDEYILYGTSYPFERRIRSTRIGLYYSFGLRKKEKE